MSIWVRKRASLMLTSSRICGLFARFFLFSCFHLSNPLHYIQWNVRRPYLVSILQCENLMSLMNVIFFTGFYCFFNWFPFIYAFSSFSFYLLILFKSKPSTYYHFIFLSFHFPFFPSLHPFFFFFCFLSICMSICSVGYVKKKLIFVQINKFNRFKLEGTHY